MNGLDRFTLGANNPIIFTDSKNVKAESAENPFSLSEAKQYNNDQD